MIKKHSHVVVTACIVLFVSSLNAQDWPEFLGPNGIARSSDEVPIEWNTQKNLLWKTELPGSGSSSPIIVGQKVFVTCYEMEDDSLSRSVVCLDKRTGKQLWTQEFSTDYREDSYRGYIQEHGYASNTPVSDGEKLFVFFGKGGVHSLDFDGSILWSADVGKSSANRKWGSASSLLLHQNLVIVNAADESKSIVALEKSSGKEIWRQNASMLELIYNTPRLVKLDNGEHELVVSVPSELWALNPSTGKLIWFAKTPMTGNVSPSVIVQGENVYSFGGYRSSGSISVRAGGKDDVSNSRVNWTGRTSSYVATPLLHEGKFYWIDDRGLANCIDAENGKLVYRERVKGLTGRPVYASPVMAGGKIYVVTRKAGTFVYEPTDKFEPIAQNKLEDDSDFNASPAISDGRIFLRSNKAIYCIGSDENN